MFGITGARYYGGNEFIDQSERACQKRALEVFVMHYIRIMISPMTHVRLDISGML